MRTAWGALAGVLALGLAALGLVAFRGGGARRGSELQVVGRPRMSQALSLEGDAGDIQKTQMLKAVWKKLRPQEAAFYPDQMWLYAGPETYIYTKGKEIGDLKTILRRGHYETRIMTFNSLNVAPVRSVCWDSTTHVMVFPPFSEYPDLHDIARKDLREYVAQGNNLVFLGGFATIGLLNDVFGFRLVAEVYQEGPFYRSPRYARGTIFEYMPQRLGEVGNVYGVKMGSMPPGARSYYDTLGESVVWSVRVDFGMVTYVGSDYMDAFQMGDWHKILRAAVSI